MRGKKYLFIFLALAVVLCASPLACPQAYGQMSTLPKYDPTMTMDPTSPAPGEIVRVATHVSYFYYQQGADPSVPDVYVRYSLSGPEGEMDLPSATGGYTNDQGLNYADITMPSSPGDYTINVYVYDVPGGEILGQGAARFTVTAAAATPVVSPTKAAASPAATPIPTPVNNGGGFSLGGFNLGTSEMLIIGAVVVGIIIIFLAALALLAFLWLRRKLVIIPGVTSAPGDGSSTIPITVKMANGLGMARKANADTEVSMETTAGSIQNAVLWKGKDSAQTSLTTSREFGTVTITAKAGDKVAKARVNFTAPNARFDLAVTPASIPADGKSTANINIIIMDESGNRISPLENMPIKLQATLGMVAGQVDMPAKVGEVNTSIVASTQGGVAIIRASGGSLKGETTLGIEDLSRRFCMHCGASISLDAPSCPKCGLTPPSGVDTKQCGTCGTVIPEAAKFCHKCGAIQPETVVRPVQSTEGSPGTKK
jgi:ribosomal protein L40E